MERNCLAPQIDRRSQRNSVIQMVQCMGLKTVKPRCRRQCRSTVASRVAAEASRVAAEALPPPLHNPPRDTMEHQMTLSRENMWQQEPTCLNTTTQVHANVEDGLDVELVSNLVIGRLLTPKVATGGDVAGDVDEAVGCKQKRIQYHPTELHQVHL